MHIIKVLFITFLLLISYTTQAAHIAPTCIETPNSSYSLWHENFINGWKKRGGIMPRMVTVENENAIKFINYFNKFPPTSSFVGDIVYLYFHPSKPITAVIIVKDGCTTLTGVSPIWLVQMLLNQAMNVEEDKENTSHTAPKPFNPNFLEVSYAKRGAFL